jgi:protein tyrosine phosphatase (PTP) superfamily phosphohydrolase (DUF442 family)
MTIRMSHSAPLRAIAVLVALLFVGSINSISSAAAADAPFGPDDVKGPYEWGTARRVTHLSRLYFADQPDRAGFEAAREAGVEIVINMRAPSETDWDEEATVEDLGMTYYNVPVTGPAFEQAEFERIEAIIAAHPDDEVLIHCGSSNRVGGWLATHLVTRHEMSEEDAMAVGRAAGITKSGIEKRVHVYLEAEED